MLDWSGSSDGIDDAWVGQTFTAYAAQDTDKATPTGAGVVTEIADGRIAVQVTSGTINATDRLVRDGSAIETFAGFVQSVGILPLEMVDEFGTRAGADISLDLMPGDNNDGLLLDFQTSLVGATSVRITVGSGLDTSVTPQPLTLGRAAIRLKMDDGLPDFEGIVPAFEPSRLKPVSAIAYHSDAALDVRAVIDFPGLSTEKLDLGTATLSATLKDGQLTAPRLGFATGDLIEAMRAQLANASPLTQQWATIDSFATGFELFVQTLLGDLDSGSGLIDLTIPGVGQSIDEMTGLKSSLRLAQQALRDAGDESLDYAAALIHSALTASDNPLRFAPDELRVAVMAGTQTDDVTSLTNSVILDLQGRRVIEGDIDLGFDLGAFGVTDPSGLATKLGLDPSLLSITAMDGTMLRYALSVDLKAAVEFLADGSLRFVEQDLSDGGYDPVSAATVTPLSVRALADLGPTDISFAVDAGSLGRFGLVAENSSFVFGLAEDTRTDASKALADQLRTKGAQLDFTVDTATGTLTPTVQGGFGMGLALSRAFGEALQAIPEFAQTRLAGSLSLAAGDVANGVTLPKIAMEFPQFPEDVSLRSLLMPQLDDFATFSIDDIIAMVEQAYEWVFGVAYTGTAPANSDITAELPFVGQSLNELLPLHEVFKGVHVALTALDDPSKAMQETLLLLEAAVNDALAGIVGWDTPPVFGISFSTLPGNVWTSGVPHRALEISLSFDNAVASERALSLDLLQALGLGGVSDLTSEVSAQVSASVGASGKLVFGGALREDASLDNLGPLEGDTDLLAPFLYIDGSSELGLSFGIAATDVDATLGFTVNKDMPNEITVSGGIEDGFIGLTNKAGDGDASLSFTLTEDGAEAEGPRFFVIGDPGYSEAAGEVASVTRVTAPATDTHLARLTLDSVAVPGGSRNWSTPAAPMRFPTTPMRRTRITRRWAARRSASWYPARRSSSCRKPACPRRVHRRLRKATRCNALSAEPPMMWMRRRSPAAAIWPR